jgi:ribosome-associated protein
VVVRDWEVAPGAWIGEDEIHLAFTRGGGPGGQHVNKVATRVEAALDIEAAKGLTEEQKQRICIRLRGRITSGGVLRVAADDSRSQAKNRDLALSRLLELLRRALRPVRPRVRTRPTHTSRARRLEEKKRRSVTKRQRRKGADEEG